MELYMNSKKGYMNYAKILQKKEDKLMTMKKKKGDEQYILNKPKVL